MTEKQIKEFRDIAEPVINWLNENFHPHITVVITPTTAEISEGLAAFQTTEFVKD